MMVSGCSDNQIGRPCNPLFPGSTGTSSTNLSGVRFVNPAPDCPSRLCMVTPTPQTFTGGAMGHSTDLSMCTATCDTDDDCATAGEFTSDTTRCTKYVCGIPSVIPGEDNFCCKKLCMCKDDLIPGFNTDPKVGPGLQKDNGVPIPSACAHQFYNPSKPDSCVLPSK